MQPVDLDDADCAFLGPHERVTFAKDQPQYIPLPVARLDGAEGRVVSRWSLTAEERAAIARGEDLYLEQLTFRHALQPVLLTVGAPVDHCPMDPQHTVS